MTVPDYQTLMLPVLRASSEEGARVGQIAEKISKDINLSPEDQNKLLPSGKQTIFHNRIHWAKFYLSKANLVETVRRGYFMITPRGKAVLESNPSRIDNDFLMQFEEFKQFRQSFVKSAGLDGEELEDITLQSQKQTPDELIRTAHQQIDKALSQELLDRIRKAPPDFFERLIVNLLLSMGYGGSATNAGRALGKSGDDGVDGVIDQDSLGLDRVYIQAKRYSEGNNVSSSAIRDFFGSLNIHKATKGLFVTTSSFTDRAISTAGSLSSRIVLIDGDQLARLMIRYSVGCRIEDTLYIKKIDEEFFG